eukprot:1524397-Alexandrium_andersonii.AAC.1
MHAAPLEERFAMETRVVLDAGLPTKMRPGAQHHEWATLCVERGNVSRRGCWDMLETKPLKGRSVTPTPSLICTAST